MNEENMNNQNKTQVSTAGIDSNSIGWSVLGFFLPIVGLILWLIWRDTKPLSAKKAIQGAIIGFIVGVVLIVIAYATVFATFKSLYSFF